MPSTLNLTHYKRCFLHTEITHISSSHIHQLKKGDFNFGSWICAKGLQEQDDPDHGRGPLPKVGDNRYLAQTEYYSQTLHVWIYTIMYQHIDHGTYRVAIYMYEVQSTVPAPSWILDQAKKNSSELPNQTWMPASDSSIIYMQ